MNIELTTNTDYNPEIHGEPFGARLVIGFTNVYYTLWRVTVFAKVENVRYIQNLSIDFGEAQKKVRDILVNDARMGDDFEIDLSLRGENGYNFFRPLAAKRYAPELLAFSRFAGKDMRKIDPNEEYYSHDEAVKNGFRTVRMEPVFKKMSGLLWATYLNKDEATVKGLRRRVIARQQLLKAGILVKIGREYITPDQVKKRAINAERAAAINGHHEENGKRISLKVKKLGKAFSFDTQYGTTHVVTLIDENNRLFKYMGAKLPDIEDEFVEIKATIKHDTYKDQPETKLQRIKIS